MHFCVSVVLLVVASALSYLRAGRRTPNSVGFYHPHTSDGGGGERVLWCAVREVMRANPSAKCVVYSGDGVAASVLATRARERFGVILPRAFDVVALRRRALADPGLYPCFTMAFQALGSAILVAEAMHAFRPAVFFDTVGHAFGYPVARVAGCRVAAYVHYPTVSSDMIKRVKARRVVYNNAESTAKSSARTWAKTLYYRALARVYGACGRCAAVVMCNSSWTEAHVRALWGGTASASATATATPRVVYPPVDVSALEKLPIEGRGVSRRRAGFEGGAEGGAEGNAEIEEAKEEEEQEGKYVVSVGQFRPEKDHALQLRAWARVKARSIHWSPYDPVRVVNADP